MSQGAEVYRAEWHGPRRVDRFSLAYSSGYAKTGHIICTPADIYEC